MRIVDLQYANGKAAICESQVCNMRMDFYGLTDFFANFHVCCFYYNAYKKRSA